MIRIILGVVAPAETFFHVDRFGATDVCAARGFPAIVIFGLVLRHLIFCFGILLDEADSLESVSQ
jgi:hypothetical protein